jgi:large subunit ribosomal protein L32e
MTAKEDVLKTLTSLKGIGKVKAESIIDAGFDSIDKIKNASIEDLTKVNGVSESVASSIQDQLKEVKSAEKPVKKAEKKTEEKPKKAEKEPTKEKPTVKSKPKKKEKKATEAPEDYAVKKKPKVSDDHLHFLAVRKKRKKQTPQFLRQEWFRYKRVPNNWRRPDGITSKMRMNKRYRPPRVRVGFRGPKKVRGLHPSGFEEILVHNVSDLENINADTQAARIGSTVGTKKRVAIVEKAKELDIRLLNK